MAAALKTGSSWTITCSLTGSVRSPHCLQAGMGCLWVQVWPTVSDWVHRYFEFELYLRVKRPLWQMRGSFKQNKLPDRIICLWILRRNNHMNRKILVIIFASLNNMDFYLCHDFAKLLPLFLIFSLTHHYHFSSPLTCMCSPGSCCAGRPNICTFKPIQRLVFQVSSGLCIHSLLLLLRVHVRVCVLVCVARRYSLPLSLYCSALWRGCNTEQDRPNHAHLCFSKEAKE